MVGVLHDINLALSFADTVLLLEEGQVMDWRPMAEFDLGTLNRLYGMDVGGHMRAALRRWS